MLVVPVLRRLRQEDREFKASLGYIGVSVLSLPTTHLPKKMYNLGVHLGLQTLVKLPRFVMVGQGIRAVLSYLHAI
jgi:hypothetical protein